MPAHALPTSRRHLLLAASLLPAAGLLSLAGCASPAPGLPPAALEAPFLLLGEVHDNPQHHAQRAAWLTALLKANERSGRATWVIFEQMDRAQNSALQQAARKPGATPKAVAEAGGLDLKGWQWPLHEPVVAAALEGHAQLAGGNLSREAVRAVVRQGRAAVPADLQALLDLPGWHAGDQEAVERDIAESHCGALPPSQFAPMALAQRVRDAAMARAMLDAAASSASPRPQVVLIAGNGHVRRDLGVPFYLRANGVPSGQIYAVGWLETGTEEPVAVRYDRVERTEAAQRGDPCEGFKAPARR